MFQLQRHLNSLQHNVHCKPPVNVSVLPSIAPLSPGTMYVYIYIYIYIHTHTHTYIHTYSHTYTHIHTYIHTYKHTPFAYFLILSHLHVAIPWCWFYKINISYIYHCSVLTLSVPHTECSRLLHDPSHTVPTLTISVLSASCAVQSFIDTHTLKQILLLTVKQYIFPHPEPQTHITIHNAQCYQTHKHPLGRLVHCCFSI